MKTRYTKLIGSLLITSALGTFAMGGFLTKYTPIMMDELNVMVPYEKVYIAPANSLEHTTIETVDGKKIRVDRTPDGLIFDGYEGKVVLLEVYGYTCGHCLASIPVLNQLHDKYKDILIITIESYGLAASKMPGYVSEKGIRYTTVAKEKSGKILSFIQKTTGTWEGVPWSILFSKEGVLVKTHFGDIKFSEFDPWVQDEVTAP